MAVLASYISKITGIYSYSNSSTSRCSKHQAILFEFQVVISKFLMVVFRLNREKIIEMTVCGNFRELQLLKGRIL